MSSPANHSNAAVAPSDRTARNRRVMPFVVSVGSGKGGVGKTLTTVNLALSARRLGLSVLILDGDFGLANVDVVLGLTSRYNISDVLSGHAQLKDIVIEGPSGISIIPSGSGITSLSKLSPAQKQLILDQIDGLPTSYDLLLIDTAAGIGDTVLHFTCAADRAVVVTTPEPHAMTDAYALIKVLAEEHGVTAFDLLINQTRSADEGVKIADRIADVARRFLKVRVSHLGNVPYDPQVTKSVMQRRAASEQTTHTVAGQAWSQAARKLLEDQLGGAKRPQHDAESGVEELWRQLLVDRPAAPPPGVPLRF